MMKRIKKVLLIAVFSALVFAFAVCANAEYSQITYGDDGLTLENEHVIYSFDKTGRVKTYTFKDNSVNYLGSKSFLAVLSTTSEEYFPTSLTLISTDGNSAIVNLAFLDPGIDFDFEITVYDDFFVFELLDSIPSEYRSLTIGGVKLSSDYDGNYFASFSYSLNYNTQMDNYPSRYAVNKNLACTAYSHLGNSGFGASFATVGCPGDEYYDVLRFIAEFVADPELVPVSKMGGPFAQTEEVIETAVQDYALITSIPSDDVIRFYLDYNVTQFDFHQGGGTFLQGNMDFCESAGGSAEGFKTLVTDRIKKIASEEYGLDAIMGLHTYAYYIDVRNTSYLSQPEVVRQLEYFVDEVYTTSSAITKMQTAIPVYEDNSDFNLDTAFNDYNSRYIRIDDEIMYVMGVTCSAFTVARGQCGTVAAEHHKGSTVYHLTGLFNMLAPRVDSDLFLDTARQTARAYVQGGFEMIYIDALDGIGRHTNDTWYYTGLFLTEIIKEINYMRDTYPEYADVPDPIFEYSTMSTSIWSVRTRTGAMDTVCRGYKDFIASHTKSNDQNLYNYTSNIGWWALYNSESEAPFYTHLQTWDVVDLLGKNIIAYNMGYSYNAFSQSSVDAYPMHKANAELLVKYLKLRDEGYFTDDVIEKISGYRDEWKLIENDGEWGFEHRDYSELKFNSMSDVEKASNVFDAQVPKLIRIQSLHTDAQSNYITVADFDETVSIGEYVKSSGYTLTLNQKINLNNYKALVVRVYGNGKGGKINITFKSDGAIFSRVIPIDFEGWKDIVLAEVDNGIFDNEFYSPGSYAFNRTVDYYALSATVMTYGDMTDVKLDTVKVGTAVYSSVTNPGISYNGSSVVFNTTLTDGSYIEFDGSRAILYDVKGNSSEITFTATGSLIAPTGDFDVTLLGTGSNTTDRARVTIGFAGEQVFNDLSNEAPEGIAVKTLPTKTFYIVGETLETAGLSIYEKMNTGRTRDVESGWTVDSVTFTQPGITKIPVTYDGFTTTFTVVVQEPAPTELKIEQLPNRTEFYVGEKLDTTGLSLKLIYNDGSFVTVTDGFTVTPTSLTQIGENTVTVEYGKFSVSYTVNVKVPVLNSISVTKSPDKTAYIEGEYFLTVGMVITGNYSSGITAEITDYTYSPSKPLTAGVTEIVIEKDGHRTSLPITVSSATVSVPFTVKSSNTVAMAGTDAIVDIGIESETITSFESLEFTVNYDTRLTYVSSSATVPEGWDIWDVCTSDGILKIALVNESGNSASPSELSVSLAFTVPETFSDGQTVSLTVTDVFASDSSFSYMEGEGCTVEVRADSVITLISGSKLVIDREKGFIYLFHDETTREEFFAEFANRVTLSTSSTFVGMGAVVSLVKDGKTVDSLTVILKGDVNGNGKIDSTDYTMAKRGYLGTLSLSTARLEGTDVNGNGYVDTNDYMQIKQHYIGTIDIYE